MKHSIAMILIRLAPWLLALTLAVSSISPAGMALEERLGLEALFLMRGPVSPPSGPVVVAISRDSARALGLSEKLYQWTRQPYAELIRALTAMEPRHIVFDIFFDGPRDPAGDEALQQAIAEAGNVLLFAHSARESMAALELESLQQPWRGFQARALATAPLILPKVPARVNRFFVRHPAFQDLPTLHAHTWMLQQPDPAAARRQLNAMAADPLLNLYGPPRTLRTLEIADLLLSPERIDPPLRNATVFIGYSADEQPDQRDGFYTAYSSRQGLDISGVELAATAYANLLEDSWLREPAPWLRGLLVLGSGSLVFWLTRRLSPGQAAFWVAGWALMASGIIYWLFSSWHWWMPWLHSVVLAVPLCGGLGMWLRSRELYHQRSRLQWAFGKYLPPEELHRLEAQRGLPAARDYHNSLCLVTDAQGYSRLSEQLSPVALAELMQRYYHAIIPPIRESGGIISDVAGDGVIALWLHLERERAWDHMQPVVSAIERNIEAFNRANPGTELPTRIGVHAGEIVLGHFGALDHHEFRAMGDIINTTSRLESANKQLGTRVLVSESCVRPEDPRLRYLGRIVFAGKRQPLRVYTTKQHCDPVQLRQFQLALLKFEAGDRDAASSVLDTLAAYYPDDGPTAFLRQYLKAHSAAASGEDAAVIRLTSK